MQIMTRIIALSRSMQLRRQFRESTRRWRRWAARRQLAAIALREFSAASKSEFPHLYCTLPEEKYRPWGSGTDVGLERLRSTTCRSACAASRCADGGLPRRRIVVREQQELHRLAMRSLRSLKEGVPTADLNRWMIDAEAA